MAILPAWSRLTDCCAACDSTIRGRVGCAGTALEPRALRGAEERHGKRTGRAGAACCRIRSAGHGDGGCQSGRAIHIQYIAHAPLEPRAAVAEWDGDKLTVWTGTQRPSACKESWQRPSNSRGKCAGDSARYGQRIWWQTYGRSGCGSRAAGEGGGQTGEAGMDASRRVHVGVLQTGRAD